ncbi:hypothetical protein ES705_30484 [subsurface metagenome]
MFGLNPAPPNQHPTPRHPRASRPPAPWASFRLHFSFSFSWLYFHSDGFTPHALGSSSSSPHHHPCRFSSGQRFMAMVHALIPWVIVGATLCSLHPLRAGILYLAPAGLLRGSLRFPWWHLRCCTTLRAPQSSRRPSSPGICHRGTRPTGGCRRHRASLQGWVGRSLRAHPNGGTPHTPHGAGRFITSPSPQGTLTPFGCALSAGERQGASWLSKVTPEQLDRSRGSAGR